MEKSIFRKALSLILCMLLAFGTFSVNVFAANEDADIDMSDDVIIEMLNDVYVSASGSDSNAGTEAAPFATLSKATSRVADGGTIHVVGTFTVASTDAWSTTRPNAEVTVTGGTLSLASANLVLSYSVIFKDITLSGGKALYANGNTVTFESGANASAISVYGGNNTGDTLDSTNVVINGGTLGSVYGGSSVACTIGQVNLTINGGTVANVIGGNYASSLKGDVTVALNGGTVTSSIFGGCYNEYTSTSSGSWFSGFTRTYSWSSSGYVSGKVDVIIGDDVNLDGISGDTNEAIFARSRYKSAVSSEDSSIIFLSEAKYTSTEALLGAIDTYSDSSGAFSSDSTHAGLSSPNLMGSLDAAVNIHVHGLSSDDTTDTITEGCSVVVGTESSPCEATTLTLTLSNKVSLKYTGSAIEPMVAEIDGELSYDEPVITYYNNVNPGEATATMSYGGLSVSNTFTISKASQTAPKLTSSDETISGKADGEIYGLTTTMEISTDGVTYNPITNVDATFAPGTYYVRYAETDYKLVSEATTVVIESGDKLTVSFLVDGVEEFSYDVDYNATLTDIPEVPAKTGYDKVAPYWDVTDFTNITSDITVNAVYTINTYTVTYVADGVTVSTQTVNYGDDAVAPEIPAKDGYTETAPYWDAEATNVTTDLTINAVYTKDIPKITPADTNNDGSVNLKDLVTIARYVAGWENTDAYIPALDIDGDGGIDLDDVNTLARYLAGWGVEISTAPYLGE